ncbi:MAG: UDP-N-acetylmuramoyl-L-alanyl-D-glutamate--2,6-diaminopimelate ligase [Rickettsiales bacterium]|jgi:UDP-N-acetylmuramoyl-L-alanyl-D-glutamate--2,6-diaminopimelate ligase|nr:UDP-N-acetylmuramoyl-L-alanyl-D-glutamate--2,6-diaminopimelate ligase [Rickettsiales bacterium]
MLLSKILNIESNIEITGIQTDSRFIKKGNVFFAINGRSVKGISFVDKAIEQGAVAIVCDENYTNDNIEVVKVNDVITSLGVALNNFYPQKPQHIIGITGTSGKTSVVEFTRQLIQSLNQNSASIGSLGFKFGNEYMKEDTLTMKELIDLHKNLDFLKSEKNVNYVAMEFTSQGLDQRRAEGIFPEIGVFLNITPEHLDYHTGMDDYFQKKMILFNNVLKRGSKAVINADIPEYDKIKAICMANEHKILSFGYNGDIKIKSIKNSFEGQEAVLAYENKEYKFNTTFIGAFQLMNLLAALSIVLQLDIEKDVNKILKSLENVKPADGRLQFAGKKKNGALIYVDYAHKPDALEKMLKAMREHIKDDKEARLGVLFGCGGDRDKTKRPVMGQIANELADFVIVTDDNPRTEIAEVIRSEIMTGCPNALNIENRKVAIEKAIDDLQPKDILVLAGKGHENYTIIGKEIIPFDEFEIVKNAIN